MSFILDTSTLGGLFAAATKTITEDRGQSYTAKWTESGFDQDLELFGFSVELWPAESVAYDSQKIVAVTGSAYGSGLYGGGTYGGPGGLTGPFILDLSTLGTLAISLDDMTIIDRGRNIQATWSQAGFDQDFEMFGYSVRFAPAEAEMAPDAP